MTSNSAVCSRPSAVCSWPWPGSVWTRIGHKHRPKAAFGDGQWRNGYPRYRDISATERTISLAVFECPRQDSNLRSRLRRPLLSPLSYGGSRTEKGYQLCGATRPVVRSATGYMAPLGMRGARESATLAPVAPGLGRVLVVDDDEVIRQLIAVNLTLEGFDVATAVDGQDCLDKVAAIDPDVITLDIMMPRLDGWVTASQLRRNPETSGIKVVLITARAQEDDKARGRQIGVDAYLTKPFDPSEMIRVVRELAGHPPIADAG